MQQFRRKTKEFEDHLQNTYEVHQLPVRLLQRVFYSSRSTRVCDKEVVYRWEVQRAAKRGKAENRSIQV